MYIELLIKVIALLFYRIIRIDSTVIIVNKSLIIFQCKWRGAYIVHQRVNAFWRFAEIQRIAVEKSAAAITSLELELSLGPEDQFPIIRGTRIYIRERGNKYGVYTTVYLHGTDKARSFSAQRWEGDRYKFLATGQYFGFPKPFRPIQMDATDNPGNCETTKLRY